MIRVVSMLCAGALFAGSLHAASTIDSEQSLSWSLSLGWVDWRPTTEQGAVIGEFVCSGFLWAPNAGWIHLGNGEPADGIHYANDSHDDYGLNHDGAGRLRGLAWSRNVGWVGFEDQGDPRVNLESGALEGAAWAPNAGWLHLNAAGAGEPTARTAYIARGKDSDGDGIPDGWKLRHSGRLDTLAADEDASGNGMTNREVYLADLDPLDPTARFQILDFALGEDDGRLSYEVAWTSSPTRAYRLLFSADLKHWEAVEPSIILGKEGETVLFGNLIEKAPLSKTGFFRVEVRHPLAPVDDFSD